MKFTYLLFAVYLLLLAAYPCADESAATEEMAVVATAHQHQAGDVDHCSPFCICSCCATHVQLAPSYTGITAMLNHNSKRATPYRDGHTIRSSYSIWQPPRLA